MTRAFWCTLWFGLSGSAWGQALDEEEVGPTLSGEVSPVLDAMSETESPEMVRVAYEPLVYEGARQLDMAPEFIHRARGGLQQLYARRYDAARAEFARLDADFPESAAAAIGDVLVWQAIMLENFDFRHEAAYRSASAIAQKKLRAAAAEPGHDGWEQFMLAGMLGIDAIHAARTGKYLPALSMAFTAIDHVGNVRELAPDFVDLQLADGIYNYWRTILTRRSKLLPDFGDHREEGIRQIQAVESGGIFLGPPATLSMLFTWLEEKDYDKALASGAKNQSLYPDNLINRLMMGITYMYKKDYEQALSTFDAVLSIDPNSQRVRFYRGLTHLRQGSYEAAEAEFDAYLRFEYMEDYQRASAHYRLGQVYYRTERYAEAEAAYKQAIKLNGSSSAKAALDSLKKARRAGTISW